MNLVYRNSRSQRGAALVIGMILLLVLTLLAISGMNTASLELLLAGNEQYRQNAFQAAETGIEQTIAQAAFDPDLPQAFNGASGADTFATTIALAGQTDGLIGEASSIGKYTTFHFQIQSTGTATRGASAQNVQGLAWGTVKDTSQTTLPGGPPSL